MMFLDLPNMDPSATFLACIEGIQDQTRAVRMREAMPEIAAAGTRFINAAVYGTLTTEGTFDVSTVTINEMSDLYKNRLAGRGGPGRNVYNRLRARANGTCPMCGHRNVATLDHYWPKHPHSALAVNPNNLVPCCWECNNTKGQFQPGVPTEVLLHPYFDDIDNGDWLSATIDESGAPAFEFSIEPLSWWTDELASRVCHHFDKLGLQFLYQAETVQELANIRFGLIEVLDAEGPAGVREHLGIQSRSRAAYRPNSWQAAMYRAMASSDWFCAGAFRAY